ncbi:TPA: hypothetical protein N0F65_003490 [Lagenidium giganteum]|uniref:Uncharacterized protein n=1 Tax=Lagenidium giganteum TaxID=4803 RepID=A0AAV2YPA8_9STRA|nr:TPA: hypothetical protein N0F65_003490 [Lagenidium giganteum]
MDCYIPIRTSSTHRELVLKAIQSTLATSLASSTSSPDHFPKETTFQYLLQNTTFDSDICSELSRSFATSTTVKGEFDFFVDGDRMWGIELERIGARFGKHMSHFGPEGKYAGLQSSDCVILDFRKGVATVSQDLRKATASFFVDDATGQTRFGEVVVKYGDDGAVTLLLRPKHVTTLGSLVPRLHRCF